MIDRAGIFANKRVGFAASNKPVFDALGSHYPAGVDNGERRQLAAAG